MDAKKLFGKNLRKYRKNSGFSQEQLAEKAGVSAKHIGSLETGSSFVSAELFETLCSILKVRAQFFFVEEDEILVEQFPLNLIDDVVKKHLARTDNSIRKELKLKILAFRNSPNATK
ncbi:MAG: helix-turn-helix transcriptional regulator [Treponema sp.]|nr:helix-turn-helix transcriptional regulator [Treponema sp.]